MSGVKQARHPVDRSMTELVDAIRLKTATSRDVIDSVFEAIRTREHSGFVRIREAARDDAANAPQGPLHGIPYARKDMYFRAGELCECGSRILAGNRPDITATVLARLDAAGAIDVGALHMAEFALSPTGLNEHLGSGRNPWNDAHITGGSSSGSGMAVGGRLVSAALGSDTGGSVRLPAAICGITGIKPTQNLLSVHGVMPLAPSLDCVGFLAQTARDCARLMSAVVGPDPLDPTCIATQRIDYEDDIDGPLDERVTIAVPQLTDGPLLSAEVHALFDDAIGSLRRAGVTIVHVQLPDFGELGALGTLISGTEAATMHRRWLAERGHEYGQQVRWRLQRGLVYSAVRYVEAMRLRPILLRRFLAQCLPGNVQAIVLPTLPYAVPTIDETLNGSASQVADKFGQLSYWTRAINYLGLPGLAVPIGFTSNGLPNSMQFVGRPLGEATLFRLGHAFQGLTDWHARAPALR